MKRLFSISLTDEIGKDLLHPSFISPGLFLLERFKSQELHISLQCDVREQDCLLLGTIAPPDTNLVSFFALSHTLKKNGAKRCTALLPYLAYTRQDHDRPNQSQLTSWIAKLAIASGIDEIITIDIHSKTALSLFSIPTISLSPAPVFAKELKQISFIPDTIVAPDKGALVRAQEVAQALGICVPLAYMQKKREGKDIAHLHCEGAIGERIVIIDDILDTGQTLISCVKKLYDFDAKEIVIMVSHGLFSVNPMSALANYRVNSLYTTNTTPVHPAMTKKISITSLFQDYLWK